ncbi:2Fe-2S iron-sulfur cluster-binding protein [Arthrobacter caoxuetaonis]|uniref:(2Fe-2S)-binding protein n=1 Tax=Arthrobacter caoxuetaonis TaxID=2886935 RepID=A0A9X1MDI6_9MICC|nr:2Fe-2S iron-sulfur cluster-binding protein [Arthrobacter caoxuetaonis]MCC3298014.1 (2Fe-2S)-binding protein [Arthrobacter caoxuetaonis]USQ57027.1 (2Fe-2S)-binding protein [Arthrobacter caoxuetaonis]
MPKVTYIQPDGTEMIVEAEASASVMRTAVSSGVPGIVAECGGSAMCATCHVYVEPGDRARLPEISAVEDEMLDCAAAEREEGSRLSCQLRVDVDIRVRIPETQV